MKLVDGKSRAERLRHKKSLLLSWQKYFAYIPVRLDDTGDWIWLNYYERCHWWLGSMEDGDYLVHRNRTLGSSWIVNPDTLS